MADLTTYARRIAKTFDDERNCKIHLAYIKLCRMYNASVVKCPRQKFQERRVLEAAQKLLNMKMKSPEEDHWSYIMKTCVNKRAQLIDNMNELSEVEYNLERHFKPSIFINNRTELATIAIIQNVPVANAQITCHGYNCRLFKTI